MLFRYQIKRGQKLSEFSAAVVRAKRTDTRKQTRHCLRPTAELVLDDLDNPTAASWKSFEQGYLELLRQRVEDDPTPFDELAALARRGDVCIGCNCPTRTNPDVTHCHTVLALHFMARRYADLEVRFPSA